MAAALRVIFVLTALLGAALGQVDPNEQVECYTDNNCQEDATVVLMTRRECCVMSENRLSFRSSEAGETCSVCVVFGFFQSTFTESEQGQGYALSVGYLKKPRTNVVALAFTVNQELLGTTTMGDFTLQTTAVAVLPNQASRQVTFTFHVDSIAQELDETVRLRLTVAQSVLTRFAGQFDISVFFLDTTDLVIVDSDSLDIQFTEEDYRNAESELKIPVRVNKNQRIATAVTVRVIPSTLTQHRTSSGRPDPAGTLPNDPNSPIEADFDDFDNTSIVVTFQPDETGQQMDDVNTPVCIVNDTINEADEQNFVVTVEVVDAFNISRITIVREDSLCRIIDDDEIAIGFQQPSYIFSEPSEPSEDITGVVLLEKENGVVSEQTFQIVVTVTPTTPSQDIRPAERSMNGADNDYTIGRNNFVILELEPGVQTIAFNFRLFADDIAEGTEAFQATPARREDTPEFLGPMVLSPNTFIIIEDDDMVFIGFERNYTVNEFIGTVDVCAVVTFPAPDVPILAEITLSVNTIQGTADEMDYGRIAEQDFSTFLQFNDMNRRQCATLMIVNDDALENTESLTIDLVFSSLFMPPSGVILDPNVTTVEIVDNDEVVIGFIDPPYQVNESDGSVNLAIGVLTGDLQRQVVLSLSTSDDTALTGSDYEEISGLLLTFGPGSTRLDVPVTIINDGVFEVTEDFSASLILVEGPADRVAVNPSRADVFILDDDELVFGFQPDSYSVSEDIGAAILNISFLSGDIGVFTANVFASSRNGTAIGGSASAIDIDFISFEDRVVTFSSLSPQTRTIAVGIVDDVLTENDEQFSAELVDIALFSASGDVVSLTDQVRNRLILQPSLANVTIVDEDEAVIGFLQTEYEVGEGDGSVTFLIGVRSGELSFDVSVIFQTADGSAVDGDDYTALSEDLIFFGTESQDVSVDIVDDDILEAVESFFGQLSVSGTLPPRVTLDPVLANVTIIDNDPVIIGFEPDSYIVAEGDGSVTLTVSVLTGILDREVVIVFTTQDDTAEAPSDYIATTQLLTFSSSVRSINISVPIEDDGLLENIERFSGILNYNDLADQTQVTLMPDTATVEITDNDRVVIGFDPNIYEVSEEDDRFVNITVRVLEGQLQRDVMVQFDTDNDSALSGEDYMAVLGRVLIFNADTNSIDIRVAIMDDIVVEPREYFNSNLTLISTDATGVILAPDVARIAINDSDTAIIGFEQEVYDVPESAGTVNVTVRLTGTIAKTVVITLNTSDGAAVSSGEADFTAHSVELTFTPNGPTEFTIPITIINDIFLEYDRENFSSIVSLSSASDAIIIMPSQATINIIDDDSVVIGFDPDRYSSLEDSPNPPSIVVRVLEGELRRNVVVTFSSQNGSAIAGEDYQAIPDMTFTFNQGTTEASIPVTLIDDNIHELDENFFGSLGTVDPDVMLNPSAATYTIVNDDVVQFTFRQPMYLFIENGVTGTVCIDKVGQTDQSVTLMVSGPLQAETSMDIDQPVTFAPEDTTQCIDFNIVDDNIALEETETFVWTLGILTVTPGVELGDFNTTTIAIMDDDELILNLVKAPSFAENAGSAQACITFSNPFARSFPIIPAAESPSNMSAVSMATRFEDYIPPDFGLVADLDDSAAGQICYEAAAIVDDSLVEDQLQCFRVSFSVPEDIDMLLVQNNSAICCIEDDDTVTIGFVPDSYSVAETTGEVTLIVQIVDGQLERSVDVDFTTSDGSATSVAPIDFIDPGRVTLQFSNQTTSQSVRIVIEDDDILENDENFFGNLATLDGSVILDPEQAEVNILEDNDEVTIGFDPESYIVGEADGSATLTVRLISGTLERNVTVFFETNPGTASSDQDYSRTTSLLTFTPTVSSRDVDVPILQDDIVESDETFFGSLDPQGQPAFVAPSEATVTILDDGDNVTIGFERTEYSVDEGDQVEVCVVVRSGTLERDAVVRASSVDDSAAAGEDYDAISGLELIFSGTVGRNCFNVTTTEDGVLEIDETFTLVLDTDDDSVILDPEQATVQIIDDDTIEVGLEETEYTTPEGDVVVEVCAVVINGSLQRDAVVTLQTQDISAIAGADYVTLSSNLTFTATQNRICRNVNILDDVIYENNETIRVFLETDDGDVTIVPDRSEGVITINDNDGVVIGFEETEYATDEPSPTLEVCVVLSGGTLGRDVVVTASTEDDTAQSPADYNETIVDLTFNIDDPIGTRRCFNIPINNDTLLEGTEQFIGNLATDEPRVDLNPDRTVIRILDDDGLGVGFINTPYMGIEGDGFATVTVGVVNGQITEGLSVVVNLSTSDLTLNDGVFPALVNVDYLPITNEQLTFTSDVNEISVNVTLLDDSIVEYDESFLASLTLVTTGTNAVLVRDAENVLIIDDDRITIGLDETFIQVSEDIGVRQVCASITEGTTERDIVVTLFSEDQSATAGSDFEEVSADLMFDQFTDQVCTNVTIFGDDLYEGDERFTLNLTTSEPFVNLSPDSSVVEIIDQDDIVVGWVQELYEVPESVDLAELCAEIREGMLAIDLPGILATFSDGTAQSPDDFIELADFQFLFEAGGPTTLCLSIPIVDDDLLELPEDFFGDLSFLVQNPSNVVIDPAITRVLINDNDTAVIGFLDTEYSVNENEGPAVLRVGIIEGSLAVEVVVGFMTADNTAIAGEDYSSTSTNLTFIGGPGTEIDQPVMIINDIIDEPDLESFIATLTRLTDIDRVTIAPDNAAVNIRDDDVVRITIEEPEYTVRENSSEPVEICVRVVEPPELGRTVIININSMDNTAIAPEDYAPVSGQLIFDATTLRQCVNVTGEEDDVVDPDEDFTVVITNGDDVDFIRNMTTVFIEENQTITVRFGEPSYTFSEDGVTGRIEVIKSGVSDTSFQVRVIGGPSDQTDIVRSADGLDDLVTFQAGPSAPNSQFVEFTLTDDEIGLEAVEMYTASLMFPNGPVPFVSIAQPNTTVINVLDDDEVTVGFGASSVTVQEVDGTFRMCVVKNRLTIRDVTVTIASRDVTATADQDYTPASIPVTVTVSSNSTLTCFEGDIIDDDIALEPTESFILNITNIDDDRVIPGTTITEIFIEDSDVVNVRFVQSKYTFNEDVGTATVCIIKDLETANSFAIATFTQDGSATDPLDYIGGSESITFGTAAGDTQCRVITIVDDSDREETEDFNVLLQPIATNRINLDDPDESTVCIEDTGITVNDTVIGDPLFTVPILVPESDLQALNTSSISLCYEVHGDDDTYLNLVTDECASVNAHYFTATNALNFIDEIGVRAVDNIGTCKNIFVSLANNCSVNVDENTMTSGRYSSNGIVIRKYPNRVRISVPNCNELTLVMWVFCETRTVDAPYSPTGQFVGDMIEFMVMRGLNFGHRQAHGLLGQFWNVPVRVSKFTGLDRNGVAVPPDSRRYVLNYTSASSGEPRTYTGWLYELTWSFEEGPCLYVGNRQAGPIYEVTDPNDGVIEGGYKSYRVPSAFSEEEYAFGLFNEDRCIASPPAPTLEPPV